jgi:2'-5' RNA ligase
MRLFIGIGLPPPVSEVLAQAARTLIAPEVKQRARITWTRPENMHVTISFLGQVEPSRLDDIEQTLAAIRTAPLHLQLNGFGSFANAGILYAQVKPSTRLLGFAEQVFESMQACGFPREQRPYSPHITLARSKGRFRLLSRKVDDSAFRQAFEAHEFRLYESFTLPQGAEYHVRCAFPLL